VVFRPGRPRPHSSRLPRRGSPHARRPFASDSKSDDRPGSAASCVVAHARIHRMSLYRTRHHSGHPPRNEARDASPSVRSRDQVREARLLGRAHLVSGRPHGRVVLGCGSNRGASLLVPSRRRRSPAGTRWFAPHINGDPDRPVRHWNLLIPAGSERRMPLARLYAPSSVRRTPAVRDSIPYRDMKFICSIRPFRDGRPSARTVLERWARDRTSWRPTHGPAPPVWVPPSAKSRTSSRPMAFTPDSLHRPNWPVRSLSPAVSIPPSIRTCG